jgi:hypothetical protein
VSDEEPIKVWPHIGYGEDFPDITKLDITLESYMSRMDVIVEVLEEQGGFPKGVTRAAIIGSDIMSDQDSEAVSQWLRDKLLQLRKDEKVVSKAPVLSGNAIGRTVIADIAITMLEAIETPGPQLLLLLVELLDVDRHRQNLPGKKAERSIAIQIEAQHPDISIRKLAKMASVAISTIQGWQKEASYQEELESVKSALRGEDPISLALKARETRK